ncbi:hypothetical protein [Gordonibacter sp. An230]|uniref:hypothetical protein n=1 Tax=Gordonibacter sp. An230 TaxID=1965592 RepID=UPI0011238E75|nr:hypothetical protein [Gordonibacter sp. An230]
MNDAERRCEDALPQEAALHPTRQRLPETPFKPKSTESKIRIGTEQKKGVRLHGATPSMNQRDTFSQNESTLPTLVELMRKTANSTSTANRAAIQLDTCIVRVSKNWFVVVGTCQK